MKKLIALFFITVLLTASTDKKPQEFEVTYTVTYNSITLQRAAELEKIFRGKFGDACKVEVTVKKIENAWTYTGRFYTDTLRSAWRSIQLYNGSNKVTK